MEQVFSRVTYKEPCRVFWRWDTRDTHMGHLGHSSWDTWDTRDTRMGHLGHSHGTLGTLQWDTWDTPCKCMGHSEHTYGTLPKLKWDTTGEKLLVIKMNWGCYTNVTRVLHLCQGTKTGLTGGTNNWNTGVMALVNHPIPEFQLIVRN